MPPSMRTGLHQRLVGAMRHALPQSCMLCSARAGTELVCAPCVQSLDRIACPCPCCALPMANGATCRACATAPVPAFDATIAPYVYAFPLDRLIQAYKYNGNLSLAGWFARRMAALRDIPPAADLLVAMPLASRRQRERGFNHALEIARTLARATGIPVATNALRRIRETPKQADLPLDARAINVRDAFAYMAAPGDIAGRSVLVIDDVMTTGASLEEVARTLKRAGAARVENWVIARTLPPRDRC